ncbi:MAG: hypothetical protein ABJD68_13015, partial [Nakamurella sp.]
EFGPGLPSPLESFVFQDREHAVEVDADRRQRGAGGVDLPVVLAGSFTPGESKRAPGTAAWRRSA